MHVSCLAQAHLSLQQLMCLATHVQLLSSELLLFHPQTRRLKLQAGISEAALDGLLRQELVMRPVADLLKYQLVRTDEDSFSLTSTPAGKLPYSPSQPSHRRLSQLFSSLVVICPCCVLCSCFPSAADTQGCFLPVALHRLSIDRAMCCRQADGSPLPEARHHGRNCAAGRAAQRAQPAEGHLCC